MLFGRRFVTNTAALTAGAALAPANCFGLEKTDRS
jgi:hypothetical protein